MENNILHNDLKFIHLKTEKIWENFFKNKKIFITGGTGFFGKWLLEILKWINEKENLNIKATILTRDYKKFQKKVSHLANYENFNFLEGDIKSFDFFQDNFNYIFHFATTNAEETFKGEDPLKKFETVANGTKRVLEFAKRNKIKKILITSSGSIYGSNFKNIQKISENFLEAPLPTDINSALGHGKRVAEFLSCYYAEKYNIDVKIARCFSFVGPYLQLNAHYAIGNFIKDALNGGPIIVKGDGSSVRSYLYSADLLIWLITIFAKGKVAYPYNVGSDEPITIKELANIVAEICGKNIKVIIKNKNTLTPVGNIYVPSIERAKKELGLKVFTPLKEAVKKTYEFYKNETIDKYSYNHI